MELPIPNRIDGRGYFAGAIVWYLGHSGSGSAAAFSDTIVASKGACLVEINGRLKVGVLRHPA